MYRQTAEGKNSISLLRLSSFSNILHNIAFDLGLCTQIDMLIDRGDRIINVCEMKFSSDEYAIDPEYNRLLQRKMSVFVEETRLKKALHLTMVTTYGLRQNAHPNKVQSVVTMDCLFNQC